MDQSPTPRRIAVEALADANGGLLNLRRLKVERMPAPAILVSLMIPVAESK